MNTLSRYAGCRRFATAVVAIVLVAALTTPAAAHHGNHSLKGKGTMTISDETTCGPADCYTVNLNFPGSGRQDISAAATGQGMTDTSTCKSKSGGSCCVAVITLPFTFDQGGNPVAGIDCAFAGTECDKPASSPTTATFKGKLVCTDGTGELMGATGTGKLSAKVSVSTGEGPVSGSIHFK